LCHRDDRRLDADKAGRAGRKPGPQPNQKLVNDALLEAAAQVGEVRIVDKVDEDGKVTGTSFEWDGKDQLVGYLRFLAVHHAPTFGGLLGRIMPTQVNLKSDHSVVLRLRCADSCPSRPS
jgi:hypothetical protein